MVSTWRPQALIELTIFTKWSANIGVRGISHPGVTGSNPALSILYLANNFSSFTENDNISDVGKFI